MVAPQYFPPEVVKIAEGIKSMKIRGAGRIARAAAKALKIAAEKYNLSRDSESFVDYLNLVGDYLKSTRPTAVSLPNAVGYVLIRVSQGFEEGMGFSELRSIAINSAKSFIEMSKKAVEEIGRIGSRLISSGDTILTHCNSSTAISVIRHAFLSGKEIRVFATETRPKFQGLITYRTLRDLGIDVTLITDSAVRFFIKKIDKVIVGADTIAANGAVVNKIGTSQIALAAQEARVRFFVASETYKFSPATVLGELVVIEERSPLEVVPEGYIKKNSDIIVRNPAFDVTPPEYIDAIITEKGIIPPRAAIMVLVEEYGRIISTSLTKIAVEEETD